MFILTPVVILLLAASALLLLHYVRPNFKYPWIIAAGGAILALIGIFLWQIRLPQNISLPPWVPLTTLFFSPTWLADSRSWPYALSLAALAAAVIWTSVVREEDPTGWSMTLLLTALGILAVSAENPLTLILVWSALDLIEIIVLLRSTEGEEQIRGIVIAFGTRVVGTGLVLWANLVSAVGGMHMNFRSIPEGVGIYLLMAVGLRLGVLPLLLPYHKENVLRRGSRTSMRLVSAAASLSLLARIPANSLHSSLLPFLLILAAIAALYAGWKWLRASDEIVGRPFWVVGMASLSVAASLRGNPTGSIGWGIMLILGGGLLFLFSARQRNILWLPLLGLWGLSALSFSPTASGWQIGSQNSWLFEIPFLPAQSLLIAGFIRHALHPGETSLESKERWTKVLYPIGLIILPVISILLGLWGWEGARNIGQIRAAIIAIVMAGGFIWLSRTVLVRRSPTSGSSKWTRFSSLQWVYNGFTAVYSFFWRITYIFTSTFEGEGGLLWSFLLLALLLSIFSTLSR